MQNRINVPLRNGWMGIVEVLRCCPLPIFTFRDFGNKTVFKNFRCSLHVIWYKRELLLSFSMVPRLLKQLKDLSFRDKMFPSAQSYAPVQGWKCYHFVWTEHHAVEFSQKTWQLTFKYSLHSVPLYTVIPGYQSLWRPVPPALPFTKSGSTLTPAEHCAALQVVGQDIVQGPAGTEMQASWARRTGTGTSLPV